MTDAIDTLFDEPAPAVELIPNEKRVMWSHAPLVAGGYIAVKVDGKVHGCWVLDPDLNPTGQPKRVAAPAFGIELAEGDAFTMMRPGGKWDHWITAWIDSAFAGIQDRYRGELDMVTLPPEYGFKRQKQYLRDELSVRIAIAMDAENMIAGLREQRAARVQSQPL